MKNSEQLAFPEVKTEAIEKDTSLLNFANTYSTGGITKREYFAGMAMQGILSTTETEPNYETIAKWAIQQSDELLKQLQHSANVLVSGHLFAFMKWYQENNTAVWGGMEEEIKRYLKANDLR